MSTKAEPKKPAKSKRKTRQYADGVVSATGGETTYFLPSSIRCDHRKNSSRWAGYPVPEELKDYLTGPVSCFTLETIEKRLASLKAEGQIDDIKATVSNTKHPEVVLGYLRLTAFMLAEARGELDQIPGAKRKTCTGVRARVVQAPKDQEGWNALAKTNLAENNEREHMTPVDLAFYIKRQLASYDNNGVPLTREAVAADVGLKPTSLPRYLQLLSQSPDLLRAVHEGTTTMAAALKKSSKDGTGTSRGKQKAMSVAKMRKAFECKENRPAPAHTLSAKHVALFVRTIAGEEIKDLPTEVQEWAEWISPDKSVKQAKPAQAPKTVTRPPQAPKKKAANS